MLLRAGTGLLEFPEREDEHRNEENLQATVQSRQRKAYRLSRALRPVGALFAHQQEHDHPMNAGTSEMRNSL